MPFRKGFSDFVAAWMLQGLPVTDQVLGHRVSVRSTLTSKACAYGHWLTEADLTFPLTLRIERYEHSLPVDTVSTAFDTYVLGGEIVAIACVSDVRVTVRCHEDVLGTLQLARLSRSEVEQLAGRADS